MHLDRMIRSAVELGRRLAGELHTCAITQVVNLVRVTPSNPLAAVLKRKVRTESSTTNTIMPMKTRNTVEHEGPGKPTSSLVRFLHYVASACPRLCA